MDTRYQATRNALPTWLVAAVDRAMAHRAIAQELETLDRPVKTADGAVHYPSGLVIRADGSILLPGTAHPLCSRDFYQTVHTHPATTPDVPDSVAGMA